MLELKYTQNPDLPTTSLTSSIKKHTPMQIFNIIENTTYRRYIQGATDFCPTIDNTTQFMEVAKHNPSLPFNSTSFFANHMFYAPRSSASASYIKSQTYTPSLKNFNVVQQSGAFFDPVTHQLIVAILKMEDNEFSTEWDPQYWAGHFIKADPHHRDPLAPFIARKVFDSVFQPQYPFIYAIPILPLIFLIVMSGNRVYVGRGAPYEVGLYKWNERNPDYYQHTTNFAELMTNVIAKKYMPNWVQSIFCVT